MNFKENHVGLISQVKYFLGDINDKSIFEGKLKFQGSNDGTTYTDIFVQDENVHEGWNYHTWAESSEYQKYRYYRFSGETAGSCMINEIQFTGVETIQNNDPQYKCDVKLISNKEVTTVQNQVTYQGTATPLLSKIEPRFGKVLGGTEVTFTGTSFSATKEDNLVTIDGIPCVVSSSTTTTITCTTGSRPGLVKTSLEIFVKNYGRVSLQSKTFIYVNAWSDKTTWGGDFAPTEMETIYVPPGLNLLVDVDKTDVLNAVIVEGSLIIAPEADKEHHRYFDAHYIFVRNGSMEVGTEEHPYDSKITITMHSQLSDPFLPIYGNKVIGCRYCTLDLHGPMREPAWTVLEQTSQIGENTITMQRDVDWKVGELIGIASTDFNGRHAEKRTIQNVDNTNPAKPIITLDKPLQYKHFAMTQTYGTDTIDMRAEVGLLSRNVRFRGDPKTSSQNQYGATIFLHSQGDDSLIARLENIEMTDVGQAFKVGRYAVHFHMIGAVHKSYARGCSTHEGYNRAYTIHGTHYLRLENNIAYHVKGHNVFIEDAAETKNFIKGNLIINAERSMSLLNTDQSPACFWITHPDNALIENHAAGSDRYSYWYDLQTHAMGPSANMNICSENSRVGEFRDNHAHSNGRYGLRIFHNMVPRKFPCKPISDTNPSITANFDGLTSWKNNRNGAIAERVGDVRFNNFKTADNLLAGIEFSLTKEKNVGDDKPGIYNALIIGQTENAEPLLLYYHPHGIITPRTENFVIRGVKFFNFNWKDSAALGSCSHCFHNAATDSGARTVRMSGLEFTNVNKRIRWQFPWKGIYQDDDGSLTEKGPKTFATPYYGHHEQPECTTDLAMYDGVTCDSTVQIRRVTLYEATPETMFMGMGLKILKYDDKIFEGMDEATKIAHIEDKSNFATILFKPKLDPMRSWATPFVTGHKYRISFGQTGINFETLKITLSERWQATDKNIHFTHNFTDVRAAIEVQVDGKLIKNNTIAILESDWEFGQNLVRNISDLDSKEEQLMQFIVSPKGLEEGIEHTMSLTGFRCIGPCTVDITEKPAETFVRLWSDIKNWPMGRLPVEDEDVHIESGWNMTMDLEETPVFRLVRINGILNFKSDIDIHFKAKHIFIRAGELNIGQIDHPYQKNCKIELFGEKNQKNIVYDNAIEAGNKLLANVNKLRMFGKKRKQNWTRLLAPAEKGATQIIVEKDLDLVVGDRLALLPTSYNATTSDDCHVMAYDPATGIVQIERSRDINVDNDPTLMFHHWGAEISTGNEFNGVDMRGEVLILSRNIKIIGQDIESWGAQVVTSDTVEFDTLGEMKVRSGQSIIDNVEFFNCSQIDTQKAAVRFESAATLPSSLTNSALHNGYAWGIGIKYSKNILIQNNVLYNFRPVGINVGGSQDITIDRNVVGHIAQRTTLDGEDTFEDIEGGILSCTYYSEIEHCKGMIITNNIVGGAPWVGYTIQGHECGATPTNTGNVAHSINSLLGGVGFMVIPDYSNLQQASECFEGTGHIAYKNGNNGAMYLKDGPHKAIFTGMTMIDNVYGLGLSMTSRMAVKNDEYTDMRVELNKNKIYGEAPAPDCPEGGGYCLRHEKCGLMSSIFIRIAKPLHPTAQTKKPYHKAKSYGTWTGQAYLSGNEFINFKAQTREGQLNSIICLNKYASDYIAPHTFFDTKISNVEKGALAYINPPNPEWALPIDCMDFPCTMPLNVLFSFYNTQWASNQQVNYGANFQIIANNEGISPYLPNCRLEQEMNAYVCNKEHLGTLMFESEDDDSEHRSMVPIYISLNGTKMANKLNSMMDHAWDGFYTGQTHLSRFPGLIDAIPKSIYNLTFTGTPAQKMRFSLRTQSKTASVIIRIAYPSAQSRNIVKQGQIIEYNAWDEKLHQYRPVKGEFCGENRYVGVKNILEFYIDSTCELRIQPREAIQSLVRMEWTLDEFFASGGTTSFMDRVAGSLGIHASTIKIVSVYEGSLVVNYDIIDPSNNSAVLQALKDKQTQQFASGAMNLGAPILDVSVSLFKSTHSATQAASVIADSIITGGVVSALGYTPIVIHKVSSNSIANGASQTIQNTNSAQISTNLSGDKTGTAERDIVTHQNDKFTPNVKIVIDKQSPKPVSPYLSTSSDSSQYVEVLSDIKENSSGTFILIAGIIIIFIFIALLTAKIMLKQSVIIAHQRNAEISNLQQVKTKSFSSGNIKQFKKINQDEDGLNEKEQIELGVSGPDSDRDDYHEQYNANQDFAIFAHKNQAVGGIMSLQEKQNIAEDMMNQSVESFEQLEGQASQKISNLRERLNQLEKETQILQNDLQKPDEIEMEQKESKMSSIPEDDEIQSLDNL